MEKNNKNLNVPNLRFPEFSGEWEKYSLGEVGSTIIGLTYSPSDVVKDGGTIVLRSSNIQDGEIDYKDLIFVNKKIKDTLYTRPNDLLVCARNGSARLIGKNALIAETDSGHTFGAFMMIYRSEDNQFIHQLLSTKRYYTQVGENLGARINQITTSDMNSFEFYFPKSKSEKDKIAHLLGLINLRISTQKKIIEDLKKLKEAICISQLKSHYETEYMIGDLCKPIAAKQYISADITAAGAYPIIQQGENPIAGYTESMPFMDYKDVILFGDHTLSIYRPKAPFLLSTDGIKILKPNDMVNRDYLYYLIYTFMPEPEGYKRYYSILKDIWVPVPNISPQKSIVGKLLSIDSKIEIEARMLELQFQQKQYLLASMFI